MSKYNIFDLEGKIDWEGGYSSALEYGIDIEEYDVSEELKAAWYEMEDRFGEFESEEANVNRLIEEEKQNHGNR
jgi:hypothetical protein